ncbi:unnamed protein product [Prunus armeniaca]|uniref:Uncharacterized protein n=1 Tax=Prunus armeniaca TaxID=36596 RepID=A0A6J5V4L1_PRUAR|nr:unnamed protein product [Prunus armeniaca]
MKIKQIVWLGHKGDGDGVAAGEVVVWLTVFLFGGGAGGAWLVGGAVWSWEGLGCWWFKGDWT